MINRKSEQLYCLLCKYTISFRDINSEHVQKILEQDVERTTIMYVFQLKNAFNIKNSSYFIHPSCRYANNFPRYSEKCSNFQYIENYSLKKCTKEWSNILLISSKIILNIFFFSVWIGGNRFRFI